MNWRGSLVRIASYEVEQLRKRLGAIVERRAEAEMRLALLHAEAEAESRHAEIDAEAGWYRLGYLEGWRARRDATEAEIAAILAEEDGARDALAQAFEELKKFEQVAENAVEKTKAEAAKLEAVALDEVGSRKAARR